MMNKQQNNNPNNNQNNNNNFFNTDTRRRRTHVESNLPTGSREPEIQGAGHTPRAFGRAVVLDCIGVLLRLYGRGCF